MAFKRLKQAKKGGKIAVILLRNKKRLSAAVKSAKRIVGKRG